MIRPPRHSAYSPPRMSWLVCSLITCPPRSSWRNRSAVPFSFFLGYCGDRAPASFRERYPPPWRVEAMPGGYKVVSAKGFTLAWVYAVEGQQRAASPNSLRHGEALALAKAIVGLGVGASRQRGPFRAKRQEE